MSDRHYCYYERAYFPTSEFEMSEEWGLVHMTEHPHTDLGAPLGPSDVEIQVAEAEPADEPGA